MTRAAKRQSGTTLIEILIALLLLSIGMLSLGVMASYAVQLPKLSSYRATAVNLAENHIEQMRANPDGFSAGSYDKPSSFNHSRSALTLDPADRCAYPGCDFATLATMDVALSQVAVRAQLPAGGIVMVRDNQNGALSATDGNLWILWQEPDSHAALNAAASDNCPSDVTQADANAKPRCLYVRFRL